MIKNKSSSIKPSESMGQIQALLAEHGARKVMMDYNDMKNKLQDEKVAVKIEKIKVQGFVD